MDELTAGPGTGWRKSSYSQPTPEHACVEVRLTMVRAAVRDSKNTNGGTIAVTPAAWRAFLRAAR